MLWRAAGEPAADADLSAFPDGAEVSPWAADPVEWAVSTGLLRGYNHTGELAPGDPITRAQLAMVLYRQALAAVERPALHRFQFVHLSFCSHEFAAPYVVLALAIINGRHMGSRFSDAAPDRSAHRSCILSFSVHRPPLLPTYRAVSRIL